MNLNKVIDFSLKLNFYFWKCSILRFYILDDEIIAKTFFSLIINHDTESVCCCRFSEAHYREDGLNYLSIIFPSASTSKVLKTGGNEMFRWSSFPNFYWKTYTLCSLCYTIADLRAFSEWIFSSFFWNVADVPHMWIIYWLLIFIL